MEVRAAFAFLLALFLAMVLVPLLMRLSNPLGLTDTGGGRKIHQGRIPRTGGAAIYIGFLVPVLLWVPLRQDLLGLVVASLFLFLFGLLDDRFNLDYRLKLLGQTLAALIVIMLGGVTIQRVPFLPDGMLPEPFATGFTLFVLVGVTNAVNLSDGLDGLAGGVSLLAIGCLLVLALGCGDWPVAVASLAVIGATFGFLRFNTFPARVFMGDSGSQFLGFSTGVLAIVITQLSDPALSPILPVLILGMPILDTLTVMIGRVSRGQSPFEADSTHIHHRLLASGLTQYEAVSLVYGAQCLLVVLAYLLRYSSDAAISVTYGLSCVFILLGVRVLERHRQRLETRKVPKTTLGRLISRARASKVFSLMPLSVLETSVPLFLVLGALAAAPVSLDVGLLAVALFAALLLAVFVGSLPFFLIERVTVYATAVSVAYLLEQSGWLMDACASCFRWAYAALAIATALWVRFSSVRFSLSSLDVLILIAVLVAPSLRGLGLEQLGIVAVESVILFYAAEVILQERERHWDLLRIGVLAALAILAVKGFLA